MIAIEPLDPASIPSLISPMSDLIPAAGSVLTAGQHGQKTAPRKVDLYDVFCAVLYLLRTGWRALPSDFPKWRTVHAYFQIWSEPRDDGSLLERALKKSGWCGPRQTGAQRLHAVLARRRAEREEHGHGVIPPSVS